MLTLAESSANRLTTFDIGADGSLQNHRVWAELAGGYPDGICLEAEVAVWYADGHVPETSTRDDAARFAAYREGTDAGRVIPFRAAR